MRRAVQLLTASVYPYVSVKSIARFTSLRCSLPLVRMAASMPASSPTAAPASDLPADRVVIYDGVCNLCHGTVKFLIQRDPGKVYRFCALQSQAAKPFLQRFGISDEEALKSIVFVDGGKAYRKSDAALHIAAYLPAPWCWMVYSSIIPSLIRDSVYDCVASNRYRVFGTSERCLMPTKDILSRFLDVDEIKKQGRKTGATGASKKEE